MTAILMGLYYLVLDFKDVTIEYAWLTWCGFLGYVEVVWLEVIMGKFG